MASITKALKVACPMCEGTQIDSPTMVAIRCKECQFYALPGEWLGDDSSEKGKMVRRIRRLLQIRDTAIASDPVDQATWVAPIEALRMAEEMLGYERSIKCLEHQLELQKRIFSWHSVVKDPPPHDGPILLRYSSTVVTVGWYLRHGKNFYSLMSFAQPSRQVAAPDYWCDMPNPGDLLSMEGQL